MNTQFSLSEKKEPQNESSSSLSVSVNKAFWIVFAAFDSFPLCSDLFGDHEAVTYLFIYLFLAADPRPPRSLVRPLLCSPDGRHAQRSAEFYLFDSDTQFTGMQVNSSKVRLTFWISSLVLILLFISIYLFIFIRHYY